MTDIRAISRTAAAGLDVNATVSQAARVPFVRPLSDIAFALRKLAERLGGW